MGMTMKKEKPARGFFPSIFPDGVRFLRRRSPNGLCPFEAARKSSICTHKPEQSTTAQENAIREDWRSRASQRLACRLKRVLPVWAYSRLNNRMRPPPPLSLFLNERILSQSKLFCPMGRHIIWTNPKIFIPFHNTHNFRHAII